jgi:3-oxoacyl-[acyl-carrier protein] reductase
MALMARTLLMELNLAGRRALVLASTKGLGRAAAEALAAEGVAVAITSANPARCRDIADTIARSSGSKVVGIAADMRDPASMATLYSETVHILGGIDILIINYPGPALGLAAEIDLEVMDAQYRMMIASPIHLVKQTLKPMRAQRFGRIVAVSGGSIVQPLPNKVMDNTFRPALVGYFKALSNEVAAEGITLNILLPGTFMTDRVQESTAANAALWRISVDEAMRRRIEGIPAGRFGELDEFAAVVAFLCSGPAAYINGSVVRVDGGQVRSIL